MNRRTEDDDEQEEKEEEEEGADDETTHACMWKLQDEIWLMGGVRLEKMNVLKIQTRMAITKTRQ